MFRVGHGFDVHAFCDNESGIVLGGVEIPYHRSLLAHSDGDVVLHAVCDALLGACGLRDIGYHFPDTDSRYKGIASTELLLKVYQKVTQAGWGLENLDATIVAQQPKLAPYVVKMIRVIADLLSVAQEQINIKATTTEHLGYVGREEGIAVHAVVLLIASKKIGVF